MTELNMNMKQEYNKYMFPEGTVSIQQAVHEGTKILQEQKIENASYDSFALLADINGMDKTFYYMHGQDALSDDEYERFQHSIMLRAGHTPLQHILGKAYFYGYEYKVNSDVLIPRPDTEVLVEQVLKQVDESSRVLDICTGSGCIILTIAKEAGISQGTGIDISEAALKVAEENRKSLSAEQVTLLQGDLFQALPDEDQYKNYDLIVSNPPYIRSDVIPTLSEEVREHDPMLALDGFEDGLYFYRKIIESAAHYLKAEGWLMFEIGYDQARAVSNLMKEHGYTQVTTVKDLAGLDRVVTGRIG